MMLFRCCPLCCLRPSSQPTTIESVLKDSPPYARGTSKDNKFSTSSLRDAFLSDLNNDSLSDAEEIVPLLRNEESVSVSFVSSLNSVLFGSKNEGSGTGSNQKGRRKPPTPPPPTHPPPKGGSPNNGIKPDLFYHER